jgi:hypothetical protein
MSEDHSTRRTVLPPAEAEGAASFAAEPGPDPTAGPPEENMGTLMEMGEPTAHESPSALGEEGNLTGGDPTEDIRARRADNEREAQDSSGDGPVAGAGEPNDV